MDSAHTHSPIVHGILVCKGQEVSSAPTAVTHHHRHGRRVSDILQHRADGVGSSLQHHTDDRHAMAPVVIGWEVNMKVRERSNIR